MSDFGSSFRKARESRGLTLAKIAAETRISTRFLEAIEKEEFGLLPAGVFSRGFIRSYAEQVGLDPDRAVAEFERLANYREPTITGGIRVSTPQPDRTGNALYPIAIAILVVLVLAYYLLSRQGSADRSATTPPPAAVAAGLPEAVRPAETLPEPQPSQALLPPQESERLVEPSPENEPDPTALLALVIRVVEPTWVRISADGSPVVAGEIFRPGTTRRFNARKSISLIIGNAGGLNLTINDQPVRSLGRSGDVRSLTITPETLKDIIG